MEKKKRLLMSTIIIGIGKFSSQIMIFFMLPLYTSHLSTSEYGTYDSLIAVATFLTPFITLLFEESMFRYLIEFRNSEKKSNVISNTLIYCMISLTVFCILYLIICYFWKFQYREYFLIYIIFNVMYSISNAIARGLGKIKEYSISNFIANFSTVIFNLISVLILKMGVPGLFISYSLGIFLAVLFVVLKLKIYKYFSLKNFDRSLFKDMFKYSLPLVPNSVSWSIINVSDRLMLTYMCSSSLNGIYSVANKFPQTMGSVYNFFSVAWKESASMELGDKEYYADIFGKILKLLLAVGALILLVLPWIYGLFVSESFLESYKYVPLLLFAMMFSCMSEFYSGILIAYKNTKSIGITTIISAVINVVINFSLMKRYGIWAAALSTIISTATVCLLRKNVIKKYIDIKIKYRYYIPYIIVLFISIFNFYIENIYFRIVAFCTCGIILVSINKDILKKGTYLIKSKRKEKEFKING